MVRVIQSVNIGLALIVLTGCAKLSIRVDVLDPVYVASQQELIADFSLISAAERSDYSVVEIAVGDICTAYLNGRISLYEEFASALEGVADAVDKANLRAAAVDSDDSGLAGESIAAHPIDPSGYRANADFTRAIERQLLEQRTRGDVAEGCVAKRKGPIDFDAILATFDRMACRADDCNENLTKAQRARAQSIAVGDYRRSLDVASQSLRTDLSLLRMRIIDSLLGDLRVKNIDLANTVEVEAGISNALAGVESTLESTLEVAQSEVSVAADEASSPASYLGDDGRTLALNRVAHAAVSAEPEFWQKRYNKAVGRGVWGSTDVVLKLNSTADFSIKGLVFDGRSTAIATRKLTASTLQLLAKGAGMAAGVPVPISTGDVNGAEGASEAGALSAAQNLQNAEADVSLAEERSAAFDRALRRLVSSILISARAAENGASAATVGQLREAATANFEANRTLLEAVAAPAQSED